MVETCTRILARRRTPPMLIPYYSALRRMEHLSRGTQQLSALCQRFHLVPQLPPTSGTILCSMEDQLAGEIIDPCIPLRFHSHHCSIYVSSDIGVTFAKTVALGSSTVVNKIRVHPTVAGDVWASTDVGLFHSTNYGSTFTQIGSGCTAGYDFGRSLSGNHFLALSLTLPKHLELDPQAQAIP